MPQQELHAPRVRRTRRIYLCECGCGEPTPLSDRTWAKYGMVKGQPLRFIKGHNGVRNGVDLAGQRFGRLKVSGLAGRSAAGNRLWSCLCDCGTTTEVHASSLVAGRTASCGCLKHESRNVRHGMCRETPEKHPVWLAWVGMRQRCTDPHATNYKDYGGRGISVCRRWGVFENFRDDMLPTWFSTGTLERKKNDGNYNPANCRWASKKEQARNRRSTAWVEVFGERMSFAEAVEKFGVVSYGVARQRIQRGGWSVEDALTTLPVR